MTNMSNHPQTHGPEPTERPVPDAWDWTAATTRQAGQQNTSHTNTEAANKKHPTQNGRPTQMQAPGQHKHMHAPQTNELRPPGPARQSRIPCYAPPPWCTHHCAQRKDASPASRRAAQKGHSKHSKEATPLRRRTNNSKPAKLQFPPSQCHTSYKAKKPDATTEPSNARPAAPTQGGQSRHAQDHRPNTTARQTVEDRIQQ
ncbi:hypothetical protein CRENBAI_003396 [Crenichthys baileyi]|uniref:Uncharacterized protein n=1 Tax=Crenichthys baileyi TaxID=28760 RepID=A0AAV9R6G5_9TELE